MKSVFVKYCKAVQSQSRDPPAMPLPTDTTRLKHKIPCSIFLALQLLQHIPAACAVKCVSSIRLEHKCCYQHKDPTITQRHSLSDGAPTRETTLITNTSLRARHSVTATMQTLRRLRRSGEGGDRRSMTRSWTAWILGPNCVLSSHVPTWTARWSSLLCQQVSLPYSSQQRGTSQGTGVIGMCCEPLYCRHTNSY